MALSTYDELKAAVATWLAKSNLTAVIPDFITLAEAEINRLIRVRDMETRATATTTAGNGFVALPDSFGGVRYVKVTSATPEQALEFHSPERINGMRLSQESGLPKLFTIIGDSFRLAPRPDAAYTLEISYYRRVPALSDATPSNWLLSAHPDVYLFGALKEAEPYLRNDGRVPLWEAKFASALAALETEDARDRYSGSTLTMRTDVGNP